MADYERRFEFLSADAAALIKTSGNWKVKNAYVDCLSAMYGLLAQFAPLYAAEVIDDPSGVNSYIEGRMDWFLLLGDFAEAKSETPPAQVAKVQSELAEKVRNNKSTALALYAECKHPVRQVNIEGAYKLAAAFLDLLIEQYQILVSGHPISIGATK